MSEAERHNLTIDIINAIVTHPKMQNIFFKPGNASSVDSAGKVISVLSNQEITNEIINVIKKTRILNNMIILHQQ